MMSEHDFHTPSIEAFLEDIGSSRPTPGGGAGAAVAGALGAALVRMHALLTSERVEYADHAKLMTAIAEQASEERATLLGLAEQDAAAYTEVLAALALPKASAAEQDARRTALDAALRGACDVPLRVMERCLEVIAMAKTVVQHGFPGAAADGAAGAELARSALRIASNNVKANLTLLEDADYAHEARARIDEIEYMGVAAATEVDSRVNDLWTPTPATPGS